MDLKNKKVTVIGLGNSGMNAAILLKRIGAVVRVTDSQDTPSIKAGAKALKDLNTEVEIGRHSEGFIKGSDLIVVSPGIEESSPAVKWAVKYKIPIIGEMELGFSFCRGKIIAVTGTNGKSTVATLIGEILKNGGKDTVVCGNIGNSLCGEIGRIKEDTWVVLEVSSFQLERIEKFRPKIALILNITDDHLDRYSRFEDYFKEKLKVYSNQDGDDTLILNYDAGNLRQLKDKAASRVLFYSRLKKANGSYIEDGNIYCGVYGDKKSILSLSDIKLKGQHNVENVLASGLVAKLVGVTDEQIRDTVRDFNGLPHRFETVNIIDGVEYIDDSKGTTVDSTRRALGSCDKPVILIAGGKDKNSDYGAAADIVRKKVKHLILIGQAGEKIKKALAGSTDISEAADMADAVGAARRIAKKGDIILLSPMCSSFDMFKDYKERGEVFKKAVREMEDPCQRIKV